MTATTSWRPPLVLIVPLLIVALVVSFESLFAKPFAFLTGIDLAEIEQAEKALFLGIGALILARMVRQNLVLGLLQARAGKALPHLIGDIAAASVLLLSATLILTLVYQRDVTAIVATGGLGLAVLGIALRDAILAVFNAAALSVENAFSVGDNVKIGDVEGEVVQTTWRATMIRTSARRLVSIPNIALGTASITNFNRPDKSERRTLELCLDYDVTVESAERILSAGVLGATGVRFAAAPRVFATRLDRDGVSYSVRYVIDDYNDGTAADHAVIKSVLQRLRDAGISIAYPKSEVFAAKQRVRVADRTLDRFVLVQQCALFRELTPELQESMAATLGEITLPAGTELLKAGQTRASLFIVGEGLLQRSRARPDTIGFIDERFVTTQFFGRRALLADLQHSGIVSAITDSLVFELTREKFVAFLAAHPATMDAVATALASPPALDVIALGRGEGATSTRARHSKDFYLGQMQRAHDERDRRSVRSAGGDGRGSWQAPRSWSLAVALSKPSSTTVRAVQMRIPSIKRERRDPRRIDT